MSAQITHHILMGYVAGATFHIIAWFLGRGFSWLSSAFSDRT